MSERSPETIEAELARIESLIVSTRRTLRLSWMLTGAALCLGIGLATMTAAALLDLLVPLSMPLRLAALCAIVLPTLLTLVTGFARPAARRLSSNHIARRI